MEESCQNTLIHGCSWWTSHYWTGWISICLWPALHVTCLGAWGLHVPASHHYPQSLEATMPLACPYRFPGTVSAQSIDILLGCAGSSEAHKWCSSQGRGTTSTHLEVLDWEDSSGIWNSFKIRKVWFNTGSHEEYDFCLLHRIKYRRDKVMVWILSIGSYVAACRFGNTAVSTQLLCMEALQPTFLGACIVISSNRLSVTKLCDFCEGTRIQEP